MPLVELARYYNSFDAGLAKSLLDEAGVGSVLFDAETSNIWGTGLIPIRLMVLDEDHAEAQQIIA